MLPSSGTTASDFSVVFLPFRSFGVFGVGRCGLVASWVEICMTAEADTDFLLLLREGVSLISSRITSSLGASERRRFRLDLGLVTSSSSVNGSMRIDFLALLGVFFLPDPGVLFVVLTLSADD